MLPSQQWLSIRSGTFKFPHQYTVCSDEWTNDQGAWWNDTGKTLSTWRTLPHCPHQLPHGLVWDQTQTSAVRSRQITAWDMAWSSCLFTALWKEDTILCSTTCVHICWLFCKLLSLLQVVMNEKVTDYWPQYKVKWITFAKKRSSFITCRCSWLVCRGKNDKTCLFAFMNGVLWLQNCWSHNKDCSHEGMNGNRHSQNLRAD
jgi:hypothetical protein